MPRIVTLTMNPAVDKSASVPRVVPEDKLRCTDPAFDPGGGGLNVARMVRRFGGRALAVYAAGGPPGDLLEKLMQGDGVDHRRVDITDWTRENLSVFEEATTLQYRFNMPGPTLTQMEWKACLEAVEEELSEGDYLVASGSLSPGVPDDFYARLAGRCRELGVRLVLDTSGEPLMRGARAGVFLLKPNFRELGHLAGRDIGDEADQEKLARNLVQDGWAEVVVVSLGAGGAWLVTKDLSRHLRSPSVPILSKVGAGDSMVAGMVHRLSQGASILDSAQFGVAAGAAAVMTPGSRLCNPEDALALYGRVREAAA